MVVTNKIAQHYREQELEFVDKVTSIVQQVEATYSYYLTDFLNPREALICRQIAQQSNLLCFDSRDLYLIEYSRVIIAPEYYILNEEDFEIDLLELKYNRKFNQLSHSQILGNLINQLGIQRSVFGDISISQDNIQIMVSHKMTDYFLQHIQKINRVPVKLKEINLSQYQANEVAYTTLDCLVSSLRLDKLIAIVLKLSRSSAVKLIEKDKVKLNYTPTLKSSEVVKVGDMISVRGYGRFIIDSHNGYSKTGKQKLIIKKLVHK